MDSYGKKFSGAFLCSNCQIMNMQSIGLICEAETPVNHAKDHMLSSNGQDTGYGCKASVGKTKNHNYYAVTFIFFSGQLP